MVAAKTRKEFITAWESHIDGLSGLGQSLPSEKVKDFFNQLKELKSFVKEAANHTFVDCEFFRLNPLQHQCVEGDCYSGNSKKTEAFGNCCMKCPKVMKCLNGCGKTETLKGCLKEEVKKKKCR